MKNIIIGTFFCLFIFSCSTKEEDNKYIIPEKDLIPILVDFHILDAASKQGVIQNNRNTYARHKHFKGILLNYNIKRERFDSTIKYFAKNPVTFKALYEKVEAVLARKTQNQTVAE